MKMHLSKVLWLVLILAVVFAVPVFADESEAVALKDLVDQLNNKISMLEQKVAEKSATPTYVAPSAPVQEAGLVRAAENIEMGGHIDVQWNNNFRQPPRVADANVGRVFDRDDGSFTLNNVELWFQNRAEKAGESGFRINLSMGEDADIVDADDNGAEKFDVQEAFVEYIAPLNFFEGSSILPDNVRIMAGRFVTLAGFEVIEAQDNWNISRSFMFGYGIPYVHDGIRTNFQMFDDALDVYLGVNNGWDNSVDNNSFKTLEVGVGYDVPYVENLTAFHSFYWGAESGGDTPNGKTWLLTNVLRYDVTSKLSLGSEANYGQMHNGGNINGVPAGNGAESGGDWFGYAGYIRYQFTDKFATSARYEIAVDDDITRQVGAAAGGATYHWSDRTFAQTYTAEYKLTNDLIARAEFRHDKSNDDRPFAFDPDTAGHQGTESSQTTIAGQLIYII